MSTILVTGGSGFIAAHALLQLLAQGHEARATVRSLKREDGVRAMLRAGGVEAGERLAFFAADLERDDGWAQAAAGCDYVLHVASPFPLQVPKDENDLIAPARDGALRVLRAARDAGVKRVVLTSSFAAVGYGTPPPPRPFDEGDWTDAAGAGVQPYIKSKTLAERAAWAFMAKEGGGLELAVVNPVGVFGPVLGPDLSTSIEVIKRVLEGGVPAAPRVHLGVVDVRDVADLHLRAMTDPKAAGERFIAIAGDSLSLYEMSQILRSRLGPAARKAPRREMPDWLVRLAATVSPVARAAVPQLGVNRNATSEKAKRVLGWAPRSREDALVATAESLMRFGLVEAA